MAIFAKFADECKNSGASADSAEVQALVTMFQEHITANYYTSTNEILAGLGKMYVAYERFEKNIDKYGTGTNEFLAKCIRIFVENKSTTIFTSARLCGILSSCYVRCLQNSRCKSN